MRLNYLVYKCPCDGHSFILHLLTYEREYYTMYKDCMLLFLSVPTLSVQVNYRILHAHTAVTFVSRLL